MKNKLLFSLVVVMILSGCRKEDPQVLTLPQSEFGDITFEGKELVVSVVSNTVWSVSSDKEWCVVETASGNGNGEVLLTVKPNFSLESRTANISITSAQDTKTVKLEQNLWNVENYTFRLPVIFHVLYNDPMNETQYVRPGWMAEVLERVNMYYHDGFDKNSVNMELGFVMATHDPAGGELPEHGVDRVKIETQVVNQYEYLLSRMDLLWDTERYINIFLYKFPENIHGLGFSVFPYTEISQALPGTIILDFWPVHSDIDYLHAISIDNKNIYSSGQNENTNNLAQSDICVIIAHELGHYLGLYHIFSEAKDESCTDSDYCADTPCYNRSEYEKMINEYFSSNPTFDWYEAMEFMKRTDCVTGETSKPNNVMDYMYSWQNRFTPDQYARVRHVLTYSPLMPGPKIKPDAKSLNTKGDRVLTPRFIE